MKFVFLLILSFFLFANFSCRKQASGDNTSTTNKTFVILGSSTAAGTGASTPDSSWVGLLTAKFERDSKGIKVINLASGGYTTYNILPGSAANTPQRPVADTERNVTKALSYHPDFIIINLPSNDIASDYSDAEILENYKKIINEIILKKTPYLITANQPRNFPDIEQRRRLKLFNDKLENVYPDNVDDYYNLIADTLLNIKPIYGFGDGIHLNNKGHKLIFEELSSNHLLLTAAEY